jgi:hypothetical protein
MTMPLDPLRNGKDPLHKAGPNNQKELFRQFSQVANGFSIEDVVGATMNMLVNSVRQSNSTRASAESRWNDWTERFKEILLNRHYDSVTGKRRNVFPYEQFIQMEHFDARDKT